MTSIYHSSDNSMHEQPEMGSEGDAYMRQLDYEISKQKCRIIPCAYHNWQDGKSYEEGVDYILQSRRDGLFIKGNYDNKCVYCGKIFHGTDKLWFCCQDCSNELLAIPITQYWAQVISIVETAGGGQKD